MAMIFNRVQGQGKLMTEELNMVEEGMPGFSKAMAKHLGVSYEAFREMVTNGEVTSEDFLTVMDDFAGGMAGAYSKSFKGMVQNTKAYVGMIGESLLSGVFEQSKGSLHEFEKLLRSDAAQKWAKDTGAKLANAFTTMSNGIKGVLKWWNGLDSSTQKTLGNIAKYSAISLVAVGPLLKVFSKLGMVISGVFGPFGKLLKFFGKLGPEAKAAGSLIGGLTNIVPKLGTAIGLLSNPVGWITLGVGALVGVFGVAYAKSEKFRNAINGLLNIFKVFGGGIINTVVGSLKKLNGWFKDLDNTINDNVNGALKKWYDNLPNDDLLKKTGEGLKGLKKGFENVANGKGL
jgi:tape measure domain-containing protein